MKLQELIQEHYGELSKSQKKVGQYVIDHPKTIAEADYEEAIERLSSAETV